MATTPQYGISQYGTSQYGTGEISSEENLIISTIPHQFNVSSIAKAVGVLQKKNVFNQFDELGYLVSLERLRGENNWSYKRRILNVFTYVANSSYTGLINGISRELGLDLYFPVIINPKVNGNGAFLAPDPYIKIEEANIYLYSDYQNDLLDYKIDRHLTGGNLETLKALTDFINTTYYFEAEILDTDYYYNRSMALLNQSSRVFISAAPVDAAQRWRLPYKYIVPNSVSFNDPQTFRKEVAAEDDVKIAGEYFIDYPNGIIINKSIPPLEATISYQYNQYPFKLIASPVILNNINSEDFKIKLFNQIQQENGDLINSIATELGVDIINEILSISPLYWGI